MSISILLDNHWWDIVKNFLRFEIWRKSYDAIGINNLPCIHIWIRLPVVSFSSQLDEIVSLPLKLKSVSLEAPSHVFQITTTPKTMSHLLLSWLQSFFVPPVWIGEQYQSLPPYGHARTGQLLSNWAWDFWDTTVWHRLWSWPWWWVLPPMILPLRHFVAPRIFLWPFSYIIETILVKSWKNPNRSTWEINLDVFMLVRKWHTFQVSIFCFIVIGVAISLCF